MKALLLTLSLALLLSFPAEAGAKKHSSLTPKAVNALLLKVKRHKAAAAKKIKKVKALSQPLVDISSSPKAPQLGDKVTLFAQARTGFQGFDTLLSAKIDGSDVTLENPSNLLWVYSAGAMTQVQEHEFVVQVFVQDQDDASQLKDALATVQAQIDSLNDQIAQATDPTQKAELEAELSQKETLKTQLQQSLDSLKTLVGEETFSFAIQNGQNPLPKITSISPSTGPASGGTRVIIHGVNFGSSPTIKIGGTTVPVASTGDGFFLAITPVFADAGSKDVELDFTSGGVQSVTIVPGGFYATAVNTQPPVISGGLFHQLRSGVGDLGESFPYTMAFGANGGLSDPDGQVKQVLWDFGDGTPPQLGTDMVTGFISHDYMAPGNYPVTLTVTDNDGGRTAYSETVNVPQTDYPVTSLHLDTNYGGNSLAVQVTTTASDNDGLGLVTVIWGDGSQNAGGSELLTATHTYAQAGVYTITVKVSDPLFARTDKTFKAYVGMDPPAQGLPPVSEVKVTTGREVPVNTPFTFDGSSSFDLTPGAGPLTYTWNLGDYANCSDGCTASGATTTYTYGEASDFYVNLQVTGSGGATSNPVYEHVFTVNAGHAPRAVAVFSQTEGVAPFSLLMDGSYSYDTDGTLTDSQWDMQDYDACDDGCVSDFPLAEYTYTEPNLYFPQVTVTDNDGNTSVVGALIVVDDSFAEYAARMHQKESQKPDPERDREKALLANACGRKAASACFELGQLYREDGGASVADKLQQRACKLGYKPACTVERK
jgi:PKD repeat protein